MRIFALVFADGVDKGDGGVMCGIGVIVVQSAWGLLEHNWVTSMAHKDKSIVTIIISNIISVFSCVGK